MGPNSGLHIIIFDEIDAICKARGSQAGSTGRNSLSIYLSIYLSIISSSGKRITSWEHRQKQSIYLSIFLPFYLSIYEYIYLSNEIDAICKARVSRAGSTGRNSYLSNFESFFLSMKQAPTVRQEDHTLGAQVEIVYLSIYVSFYLTLNLSFFQ